MESAFGILAVLALIAVTAICVGGEFALLAVDRERVEALAQRGDRRARRVRDALGTLSFQLSGAQLGITWSSLVMGLLVEPIVAPLFRPLFGPTGGVVVALVVATAAMMALGEHVPKNLAIARPEPAALRMTGPLHVHNRMFRPLIVFLNNSANRTVRLLGIEPREELSSVRSLEELHFLIHSSAEAGTLDADESALLARAIAFSGKRAVDAMVPRPEVTTVRSDDTVADLVAAALVTGHSRFPVTGRDRDDVTGVVHVKDVYAVPIERRAATPVAEIARPPLVVVETCDLESLLTEMRREAGHFAVVVDEYGGTAGILTLEDIIEEIVGEIDDEHDDPGSFTSEDEWILPGTAGREDVNHRVGFALPEGTTHTLAGYLLTQFGRVPQAGDRLRCDGFVFEVLEVEGRRIAQVRVVKAEGRS
jgi:CBS domain containing-hemolysin-like protein